MYETPASGFLGAPLIWLAQLASRRHLSLLYFDFFLFFSLGPLFFSSFKRVLLSPFLRLQSDVFRHGTFLLKHCRVMQSKAAVHHWQIAIGWR